MTSHSQHQSSPRDVTPPAASSAAGVIMSWRPSATRQWRRQFSCHGNAAGHGARACVRALARRPASCTLFGSNYTKIHRLRADHPRRRPAATHWALFWGNNYSAATRESAPTARPVTAWRCGLYGCARRRQKIEHCSLSQTSVSCADVTRSFVYSNDNWRIIMRLL